MAAISFFCGRDAPNPFTLEPLEPDDDGAFSDVTKDESVAQQMSADAHKPPNSPPAAGALGPDTSLAARYATLGARLARTDEAAAQRAEVQGAIDELCELRDSGGLNVALAHVNFDAVGDDVLRRLFEALVTQQLSYASCAVLVERALTPRVLALEQPASRVLFTTLELTLACHPKAIVDGLLVPTFAHEQIGPAQSEVVCRLLKEAVKAPLVEHFLQVVSTGQSGSASGRWGEQQLAILQQAINRKVSLSSALVLALLEQAAASSERHRQSLKFAKLLLTLVQRFGAELAPHAELALSIAQKSETFMKGPLCKAIAQAAKRR